MFGISRVCASSRRGGSLEFAVENNAAGQSLVR